MFDEARYKAPFQSDDLPMIPADYVTSDSGTGLVHSAPSHGMEDYQAFKSMQKGEDATARLIPSLVDADGLFQLASEATIDESVMQRLIGKAVLGDGAKEVIQILREQDLLVATKKIRHKYPYDWKTKQPVIIRATPQWFANLDHIKDKAMEALKNVHFVPEQGSPDHS